MENKMIRFVLWSVVIMCLLAFGALALAQNSHKVSAQGSATSENADDAEQKAKDIVKAELDAQCDVDLTDETIHSSARYYRDGLWLGIAAGTGICSSR